MIFLKIGSFTNNDSFLWRIKYKQSIFIAESYPLSFTSRIGISLIFNLRFGAKTLNRVHFVDDFLCKNIQSNEGVEISCLSVPNK